MTALSTRIRTYAGLFGVSLRILRITLIAFKSRLILFSLFKDLKCPRYLC